MLSCIDEFMLKQLDNDIAQVQKEKIKKMRKTNQDDDSESDSGLEDVLKLQIYRMCFFLHYIKYF